MFISLSKSANFDLCWFFKEASDNFLKIHLGIQKTLLVSKWKGIGTQESGVPRSWPAQFCPPVAKTRAHCPLYVWQTSYLLINQLATALLLEIHWGLSPNLNLFIELPVFQYMPQFAAILLFLFTSWRVKGFICKRFLRRQQLCFFWSAMFKLQFTSISFLALYSSLTFCMRKDSPFWVSPVFNIFCWAACRRS